MSSGIGVDFSLAGWKFTPGAISEQLMKDYTAEVQPKGKAAAA